MTLLEYIRSLNARSQREMEEARAQGNKLWIGMLTEDLEHWAEQGVHTAEDFVRRQDEINFSEMHKSAFGSRPRMDTSEWTAEDFQKQFDVLADIIEDREREEREMEQRAEEELEAEIEQLIKIGARDRATALRWMTQCEDFYHEQCVDHWVWERGLLCTEYGRRIAKELMEVVTFKEFKWA